MSGKNALATLYGAQQRRERYGKDYANALSFLRDSQYWSNDQLHAHAMEANKVFLARAFVETPYYCGNPEYRSFDIGELPILKKQSVRENLSALVAKLPSTEKVRFAQTSGTTGTPLSFPLTQYCFQREYAFRALHYEWGGVSLDARQPIAICAGHPVAHPERQSPPFWVHDHANNWLLMSSYHLTPRNIRSYIEKLEQFQPVLLGGYPSSVFLLAAAYERHGTVPLNLRSVFTGSETLYAYQRERIERAFSSKVFNWYGNSEMCANIVECEYGEMHLKLEHSFVEVLNNSDEPCNLGEEGRLICTGFGNRAFPLVRYDIGDSIRLSSETHSRCGRGGTLVAEVIGRQEAYIVTPDGRIVGRLDHIFKGMQNVVEAQILQDNVDEITIRIKKAAQYSIADERIMLDEARVRLGNAIRIVVDYVDSLPRGRNGKLQFIISSLDQNKVLKDVLG